MEQTLKVILLDDEVHAIENLESAIQAVDSNIDICRKFTDPIEAIIYAKNNPIDIFFIDISMPLLDGFEVLQKIGDFITFKTVFVTAYSEYAIQAFKHHAFDYLLKPINSEQLQQCLADYRLTYKKKKENHKMIIQSTDKTHFVSFKDILYLQADNSYTKLILETKSILTSKPISYFTSVLDEIQFFRCHNSYIINKSHISEYHKKNKTLVMDNRDEIPVSRTRKEHLFNWI